MSKDAEFLQELRDFLGQFDNGSRPVVPRCYNADGSINRDRTLALPCYEDFKLKENA